MEPSRMPAVCDREQTWSSDLYDTQTVTLSVNEPWYGSIFDPPRAADEIGPFEHYRILRKLGEGGMGLIFQAEDTHLKRHVALKVLHPRIAEEAVARQRFLREAQAMAAIHHDNVVAVYQVGVAKIGSAKQDLPFLAMQYLEGESLQDRIARDKCLPIQEVARIGRKIAEGLAAAHAKGLVHRDIKPSNIWLTTPNGRVKILDFGLARLLDGNSNLSSSGQIIGTPSFMSPEQARGDVADPRSDLFSLGCVLYRMLTGTLPFDGPSPMAVLSKVIVEKPLPLAERMPAVPGRLARLIHRLMAKASEARPPSAAAVAAALNKIENMGKRAGSRRPSAPRGKGPQRDSPDVQVVETLRESRSCELPTPPARQMPGPEPAPFGGKISRINRRSFLLGAGSAVAIIACWRLLQLLLEAR
jgi:serine/threonine protein kinase